MKISYTDADGRILELEVSDEVGNFHIESQEAIQKNDRAETRRHTPLSTFLFEDARYFDSGIDISRSCTETEAVRGVMRKLTDRERFIIIAIHFDGCTYSEIAKAEGKSPSTIMREANKATDKFKRLYNDEK